MEEQTNQIFTKKNIISFLVIGIVLLSIPFGVQLVLEQTQFRSRAAIDAITFVQGDTVSCKTVNNKQECTTTSGTVPVELRSPLGPPGPPPPTASPTPLPPEVSINISGQSGREINVNANQAVTFNVVAIGLTSKQKLSIYATKEASPNNIAPDNCPSGSILGTNREWCLYALNSTSSFTWITPSVNGTYYVFINMDLVNPGDAATVFHCTGNPWCTWSGQSTCPTGSNCISTCSGPGSYNWSNCGNNDYIKLNIISTTENPSG